MKLIGQRQKLHPYDEYRRLIRTHWYPKLSKKCDRLKQEGKFPFEGGWYSETEIAEKRDHLRKRDRELLADMVVLFGTGIGLFALLILFMFLFLLP